MWALEFEYRLRLRQFKKINLDDVQRLLDNPLVTSRPHSKECQKLSEQLTAIKLGLAITDHGIPSFEEKPVIIEHEVPSALGKFDCGDDPIRPARYMDVIFNLEDDEEIDEDIYYDFIDDHPKRNLYSSSGFFVIDFGYTNAQLKSSLEKVASQYRDSLGFPEPSKRVTESKIRLFHQHKILAVLDLRLWCDAYGAKLTQGMIAEIVFPEREYFDCNYRKTIQPLEKLANSPAYLKVLKRYDLLG